MHNLPTAVLVLLLSVGIVHTPTTASTPPRPNIVFILADDLGINDLGVYGQNARRDANLPYISTPHLDALAQGGVRFTEMYTPATVCAPTRVSLLTGFHGGHASVDSNGLNSNGGNAMRAIDYSFAQGLQASNYTTGVYGKWGSGMDGRMLSPVATGDNALINHPNPQVTHPGSTPSAKGFDEFYGYLNHIHAHNYYVEYLWEHDTDNSGDVGGVQVDWSPTTSDYSHDLIAAKSIQFIKDHASSSEPFFMYGEYTIPHSDFNPPNDEFLQFYTSQGLTGNQADYAAMISRMDANVGQIIETLKDPNGDEDESDSILDDTLIIFASDNGPTGGANGWFDSNGIYRGVKNDVFEGAHRTPFIASWPGTIVPADPVNGDVNSSHVGQLTDLFATFSDLAGVETPLGVDSRSMAGLFTGTEVEEHDYLIWEVRPSGDWAIRMGQYKLLKAGNNVLQLYNLSTDPSESNNLLNSPTAEQSAIASLLQTIALDEGVEADAGNRGAQNTHIVQYKAWASSGGSTGFELAGNWSGGTQLNTRGTPANNFSTGPASNWIIDVDNTTGSPQEIAVTTSSEVLAMEISGSSASLEMKITQNGSLMARNGAKISSGASVELDGGELLTVRSIEIQQGGVLKGRGAIATGYDTTGTPFSLDVEVVNEGLLEVGGVQAMTSTGGAPVDVVTNGGFESGTAFPFSNTDNWFNFAGSETLNARNLSNPSAGSYRGIVGLNSNGSDRPSPAQATGHAIALGDIYTLEFDYAGAGSWDEGTDQFRVILYYEEGGVPVDLFSWDLNPAFNFGSGYETFAVTTNALADAAAVGNELHVRFDSLAQSGEFASIDEVSLLIGELPPPINVLSIEGDFVQSDIGALAFDLWGDQGVAGIDYDRLVASGDVTLDGTIQIALGGGFVPTIGDQFPLLIGREIFGEFSNLQAPEVEGGRWEIQYAGPAATLALLYAADFNSDGVVNETDLGLWQTGFGMQGSARASDGDANGDGIVDGSDYLVWQRQFGNSVFSTSFAVQVPEAGTWQLMIIGVFTLNLCCRITFRC